MISQNLINDLVGGYTQGRFEEKYLREKIREILKFIIPQISALVRERKEEGAYFLWEAMKKEERIKNIFAEALKIVERPIVIYVASKFINNKAFGTKIVEEALIWK